MQAFEAGELLSIHIQQCADVCASATHGLCFIIPKAKQLSYLQEKVAEQFLQLLLATLQLFVGAADIDIMFRLPGLAEQL